MIECLSGSALHPFQWIHFYGGPAQRLRKREIDVSAHVQLRTYVASGRRVGNFLNTAQLLQSRPTAARGGVCMCVCVGCNTG